MFDPIIEFIKMNKNYFNPVVYSKKLMWAAMVSGSILIQSCSSSDGSPRLKEFDEKTIHESTKGTVTEVEEIEPGNEYQIIDERIIDSKEDSYAIIHTLEGTVDTLSLRKLPTEKEESARHSGLNRILMFSLARSYFSNNLSNVTPDSRFYKNDAAFNKSNGLKTDLQNSASTRSVKVPKASSSGYGAGKSFRSFGG